MSKQFHGANCIFCTRPSSRTGEHALPRWVIRTFGTEDGPFTTWVNGLPLTDRAGSERKSTALLAAKLPMCLEHNSVLADRFESPITSIGRRILEDTTTTLNTSDAATFGLWTLKTLLMLAHPQARYSDGVERRDFWELDEPALWSWTVEGLDPPEDMTLWVSRRDDKAPASDDPTIMPLPTTLRKGTRSVCQVKQFGLSDLDFTLLSHPGWVVEHPAVADGEALRLWPRLPSEDAIELSTLPAVPIRTVTWLNGPTLTMSPTSGTGTGTNAKPLLSGACTYDTWHWMIAAGAESVVW